MPAHSKLSPEQSGEYNTDGSSRVEFAEGHTSSSQYRFTPVKPLSLELLRSAMLSTVPRSAGHKEDRSEL